MYPEDEPKEEVAWSEYIIHGNDDEAMCHWATNDDADTGYPSTWAEASYHFKRREIGGTALQQAVRHAGGGSRQGIGHKVYVRINGKEYKGGKDYTAT